MRQQIARWLIFVFFLVLGCFGLALYSAGGSERIVLGVVIAVWSTVTMVALAIETLRGGQARPDPDDADVAVEEGD